MDQDVEPRVLRLRRLEQCEDARFVGDIDRKGRGAGNCLRGLGAVEAVGEDELRPPLRQSLRAGGADAAMGTMRTSC